jgi:hypothetical protein
MSDVIKSIFERKMCGIQRPGYTRSDVITFMNSEIIINLTKE